MYKATHIKTGIHYCLRRIHGFRLQNTKCLSVVEMWKKLNHSNIVQLKEVFTTKAFGDNSLVFVYRYSVRQLSSQMEEKKTFLSCTATIRGRKPS